MPFARLTLHSTLPDPDLANLANRVARLIADVLHKRYELTSVLVESPGGRGWTIGGTARQAAAHLDVTVTAGTNSPDEKAEFIQRAMALLREELPDLHTATYVVVSEAPAGNWGYDGQTQGHRALALGGASASRDTTCPDLA